MQYTNPYATVTLGTSSLTLGTTTHSLYNNSNIQEVVFNANGKQITLSEIVEMKQNYTLMQKKVEYLEKLIEEFMYLPDVGPAFFAAKKHFDLAQEK